jgi:hypothetical protein
MATQQEQAAAKLNTPFPATAKSMPLIDTPFGLSGRLM